jgi:hypothetical protein
MKKDYTVKMKLGKTEFQLDHLNDLRQQIMDLFDQHPRTVRFRKKEAKQYMNTIVDEDAGITKEAVLEAYQTLKRDGIIGEQGKNVWRRI